MRKSLFVCVERRELPSGYIRLLVYAKDGAYQTIDLDPTDVNSIVMQEEEMPMIDWMEKQLIDFLSVRVRLNSNNRRAALKKEN